MRQPSEWPILVFTLRRDYNLVVIDAGGHVSPTQAAAVEMADEVVVITTPDVLAVRAMRKRIQAWESLGVVSEGDLRVLLNKADKAALFPPDAVAQLTTAPVFKVVFPLMTRSLEESVNSRDPRAVTDAAWWRLMAKLRSELGLGAVVPGRRLDVSDADAPPPGLLKRLSQRGAIALETAVMIPVALLVGLMAWQLAVTGLAWLWSGQAMGLAAREYAISGSVTHATQAARAGVPAPFSSGITVSANGAAIRVAVPVPASLPARFGFPAEIASTKNVVREP